MPLCLFVCVTHFITPLIDALSLQHSINSAEKNAYQKKQPKGAAFLLISTNAKFFYILRLN